MAPKQMLNYDIFEPSLKPIMSHGDVINDVMRDITVSICDVITNLAVESYIIFIGL